MLTAAKNAIVSWLLNFRILMLVKSAVIKRTLWCGVKREQRTSLYSGNPCRVTPSGHNLESFTGNVKLRVCMGVETGFCEGGRK